MNNNIECPNCGHHFPVENAISSQVEKKLKEQYEQKVTQQALAFNKQKEALEKEKDEFEKKREKQNELFAEHLKKKIEEEKAKLEKIKQEEFGQKIKQLEEDNERRKNENLVLKQKELEMEKRERDLKEKQEEFQLEMEKKLLEKSDEIAQEVKRKEQEKNDLRIKEYEKKLEDQKKLIEEMQRKAEQGSMQLQGEVQELAIEDWLRTNFPLDHIDEIKKGVRGADCMQVVNTRSRQNCGTIYYESKRTKDFQPTWIEKFKTDLREKGATLGVLVTDTLPKGMDRMGQREGIWICTFEEFKGLCFVLRESVILMSNAVMVQENKGDKMSMLYDYLTGNEFRMQVEAIVEGFTQMNKDLESEKRAMDAIWKKREKQIHKVLLNTTYMYGSIRGIAGSAIGSIKALELPDHEEDIQDDSTSPE